MTLKQAARNTVSQFTNFDQHLGASQERRTERARDLYRKGMDEQNDAVNFWFKRSEKAGLCGHLSVASSCGKKRWHAVLSESGWMECSCPDRAKGNLCKHLRALAGMLVRRANDPAPKKPCPPNAAQATAEREAPVTGGHNAVAEPPAGCDWR